MKALRLALATGILIAVTGLTPAAIANDCSDPKKPCGGCTINRDFSLEDPRPVICYPT